MNQLSGWAKQGAIFKMVILPTSLADQDHLGEKDNVCHFIADQDHLREMDNLFNSVTDFLLDGDYLRGTSKENWQGNHGGFGHIFVGSNPDKFLRSVC